MDIVPLIRRILNGAVRVLEWCAQALWLRLVLFAALVALIANADRLAALFLD